MGAYDLEPRRADPCLGALLLLRSRRTRTSLRKTRSTTSAPATRSDGYPNVRPPYDRALPSQDGDVLGFSTGTMMLTGSFRAVYCLFFTTGVVMSWTYLLPQPARADAEQ